MVVPSGLQWGVNEIPAVGDVEENLLVLYVDLLDVPGVPFNALAGEVGLSHRVMGLESSLCLEEVDYEAF